jgi:hypothetical protein
VSPLESAEARVAAMADARGLRLYYTGFPDFPYSIEREDCKLFCGPASLEECERWLDS